MDSDTGQVSAFLNKLWSIIEDPELDDIICWDDVWNLQIICFYTTKQLNFIFKWLRNRRFVNIQP